MKNKLFKFLSFVSSLFIIYYLLFIIPVLGATPTPTSDNSLNQIKQQLITNIASKVAELKLVEKRGIIGQVSDVSNTQITLVDAKGNTRFADVDELTRFSSPSQKTFGISDISKGATLGILGLYNKESRRILSRFVNVLSFPKFIHGVVTSSDNQNYVINIKTESDRFNVDVETTTKTFSYTKDVGFIRAGFSKIKENQNIIAIGFPDTKDPNHIISSRIIILPDVPKNPNINVVPVAIQTPTIVSSTGSGKKLIPIIK